MSQPGRLVCAVLLAAAAAHAQHSDGAKPNLQPGVDIALTYAASYSAHVVNVPQFWLQGGALEVNAPFYHGLGLAASATGLEVKSVSPSLVPLDLLTIAFGPRYTYTLRPLHHRVSVFGEALLGEAHGFHSVFSIGSGPTSSPAAGTTDSANALALQTGGGLDIRLKHHLSIRAIQVDYLRTELPNGGTNVQNNLRLAGGLVYRFSK